MSLRSKEVKTVSTFRLWWRAHWSDVVTTLLMFVVLFALFGGVSIGEVLLFRTGSLFLQALALLLLVGEWAAVLFMVVKD